MRSADLGGSTTDPLVVTPDGRPASRNAGMARLLGPPSAAIAERRSIAEAPVRHHVEQVLSRLGVHGRLQAVRAARDARRAPRS